MENIYFIKNNGAYLYVALPISLDPDNKTNILQDMFLTVLVSGMKDARFLSKEKKEIWRYGGEWYSYDADINKLIDYGIISTSSDIYDVKTYSFAKSIIGTSLRPYSKEADIYITRIGKRYPKLIKVVR